MAAMASVQARYNLQFAICNLQLHLAQHVTNNLLQAIERKRLG